MEWDGVEWSRVEWSERPNNMYIYWVYIYISPQHHIHRQGTDPNTILSLPVSYSEPMISCGKSIW